MQGTLLFLGSGFLSRTYSTLLDTCAQHKRLRLEFLEYLCGTSVLVGGHGCKYSNKLGLLSMLATVPGVRIILFI